MAANIPVKLALHKPTNLVIHIENASNGLSCNCVCLECNESLEAIQGDIRQKHFRHYVNKNCLGAQETALHILAKQIIVDSSSIAILSKLTIQYEYGRQEVRIGQYTPDVQVISEGSEVYFGILVTNPVSYLKERFFKDNKLKSVEIDLRKIETSDYEGIKEAVLWNKSNRRTIYWFEPVQDKQEPQKEESGGNGFLTGLAIAGFIWLFCKAIFKKKRRK